MDTYETSKAYVDAIPKEGEMYSIERLEQAIEANLETEIDAAVIVCLAQNVLESAIRHLEINVWHWNQDTRRTAVGVLTQAYVDISKPAADLAGALQYNHDQYMIDSKLANEE